MISIEKFFVVMDIFTPMLLVSKKSYLVVLAVPEFPCVSARTLGLSVTFQSSLGNAVTLM